MHYVDFCVIFQQPLPSEYFISSLVEHDVVQEVCANVSSFIMSEDLHERCFKCLSMQHAQAMLDGTSNCTL